MKSLGIVSKGNAERDEQRKRIRNMEEYHEDQNMENPKRKRPNNGEKMTYKRKQWEQNTGTGTPHHGSSSLISHHGCVAKIPAGFLTLLDEIGLDQTDAEDLYKNKEQWKSIESARMINCTARGCKFGTTMATDCLTEHCIKFHGWRVYPCPYDYCKFEAYSPTSYKLHLSVHTNPREGKGGSIACDRGSCPKRFTKKEHLQSHLNIHDNVLYRCHFCPWTGVLSERKSITQHFDNHFRNRLFPCSLCEASFYSKAEQDRHEDSVHHSNRRVFKCGSCEYESTSLYDYKSHHRICKFRKIE